MRKFLIFVYLFIMSMMGCSSGSDIAFFQDAIEQSDITKKYDIILVIPGTGCHGCITGVEFFVKEHIQEYDNVLFVFTGVKSIKVLKMKLGNEIMDKRNVQLDLDNVFLNYTIKDAIYPVVVYLKNKRVCHIEYVSPANKYSIEQLLRLNK